MCGLLAGIARADNNTFHLTDGSTVTGEMVSMDGPGFILKGSDGSYGERMPWTKLSQADLKELEQNPKAAQWVEPFVEPDPNERLKRTEVEIRDYSKLPHPTNRSLVAA